MYINKTYGGFYIEDGVGVYPTVIEEIKSLNSPPDTQSCMISRSKGYLVFTSPLLNIVYIGPHFRFQLGLGLGLGPSVNHPSSDPILTKISRHTRTVYQETRNQRRDRIRPTSSSRGGQRVRTYRTKRGCKSLLSRSHTKT